MKYAENSLKSGYNTIMDSLPGLHISRESSNTVSFRLPNVTVATFVQHFLYNVLNNLTPELMKSENRSLQCSYIYGKNNISPNLQRCNRYCMQLRIFVILVQILIMQTVQLIYVCKSIFYPSEVLNTISYLFLLLYFQIHFCHIKNYNHKTEANILVVIPHKTCQLTFPNFKISCYKFYT